MRRTAATALVGLMMIGCGSSSSTTRGRTLTDNEAGMAGSLVEPVETGGTESTTGGANGETGGTGGTVVEPQTGGSDSGGGTGGDDPVGTGGAETGGEASGGTGNVGGGCEPWDCTNIAISLTGWSSDSGNPIPEACGLVQDPCTGMMVDCGGCDDPLQGCARGNLIESPTTSIISEEEGIENICGGNCIALVPCADNTGGLLVCTIEDQPPQDDCFMEGPGWCCLAG